MDYTVIGCDRKNHERFWLLDAADSFEAAREKAKRIRRRPAFIYKVVEHDCGKMIREEVV